VNVVCCQVEVSATGRSLVQRSPAECGVCVCVIECDQVQRYPSTPRMGRKRRKKEICMSKLVKGEKKRPCGGVVFIEVAHPPVYIDIQIIGVIEIYKILIQL
jgi:hypothetical protein